ncbi:MAG: hypothetical protein AB7H92_13995 [Microbacteriaceae bacterium]
MVATRTGLGRSYDIIPLAIPIDLDNSQGGDQFSLRDCSGFDLVAYTGDGAAGRDFTFTIKRHVDMADGTGTTIVCGSATDLRNFFYKRHDSTVVGVGTWTKGTWFDADGDGVVVDAAEGEDSRLMVIPFSAQDLGDGYSAVSITAIVAGGSGAKIGCAFAILWGLDVQRAPENLRTALA